MWFQIDDGVLRRYLGSDIRVEVPDGVKKIGKGAFKNLKTVKEVVLPQGVTEIEDESFSLCQNLEKIVLPSSLERIGEWAFFSCKKLKKVELPQNLTKIDDSAFIFCESIEKIIIPEGVGNLSTDVFSYCKNLREVELPENLEKISKGAFKNCAELVSINIPEHTQISPTAFFGCEKYLESKNLDPRIPYSTFLTVFPLDENKYGNDIFHKGLESFKLEWKGYSKEETLELKRQADGYSVQYTGNPKTKFGECSVSAKNENLVVKDGKFYGYKTVTRWVYDGRPSSGETILSIDSPVAILTDCDVYPEEKKIATLAPKNKQDF